MNLEKSSSSTGDFLNSVNTDESLDIAAKNWSRLIATADKVGYKDGMEDGSDSVFQEGFDKGYKEAFKIGFLLGKFKSLKHPPSDENENPQDINKILDISGRSTCYMCKLESENTNDLQQEFFSEIINKQRMQSAGAIGRLYNYFEPVIKQLNIDMPGISEIQNLEKFVNHDL